MKLLQQAPQQTGAGSSNWSGGSSGLSKPGKPSALALLEMQQEAERLLKQQRVQQQRERVSLGEKKRCRGPLARSRPFLPAALGPVHGELLHGGAVGRRRGHVGGAGVQKRQRRLVEQHGLVGRGLEEPGQSARKQQQPGPEEQPKQPIPEVGGGPEWRVRIPPLGVVTCGVSFSEQYMMRRKRTEEEEKLLKLLQGMKPQDGFTTWCEQMLHALNSSANNSSCSLDGRPLSFHPEVTPLRLPMANQPSAVSLHSRHHRGVPEGGGVSLCSAGFHPVLPWGHRGSQRVCQTVSGAPCQTESQPTEAAAAAGRCRRRHKTRPGVQRTRHGPPESRSEEYTDEYFRKILKLKQEKL